MAGKRANGEGSIYQQADGRWVAALTGPDEISAIVVPSGTPGFEVGPGYSKVGWCASDTHPLHLDDTLSKIQRPKIDDADDYTFIVMHFPVYSRLVRVTTPSEVDIFVGAHYLITVHSGNLKPLVRLFKQCAEDTSVRAEVMGRSTGLLLYEIIDKLVDYCFPILDKIDVNIDQVEDEIFEVRQLRA